MSGEHPEYVSGLLEERRGYVLRGLSNRVAEVDAELKRFGVVAADVVEASDGLPEEVERPGRGKSKG